MTMEPLVSFKVPANVKVEGVGNDEEVEGFKHRVNEVSHQVDKLENKIHEIEHFFSNNRKKQHLDSRNYPMRDNDKGRRVVSSLNQQGIAASKRMEDLMIQFGTILNQITQRRGVSSSLDSVDVDHLGLQDSAEVLGKPKDLNSIRKRMEAKDGSSYKHVREIYADVRWVLKNAMKNNDERSDAHVTAKTLLDKFEEKWLLLLPKIMQEEERREEEDGLKHTSHAQMAKDVSSELHKIDFCLRELREVVLRRCRRMSTLEKRELGRALTKLSAEDLTKALEIVAQGNPNFQANAEEVDLDIDAQSESTLWRLKLYIVERMQGQYNQSASTGGGDKNDEKKDNITGAANTSKPCKSNAKRKRESVDGVVKSAKKKSKNVGSNV